MRAEAAIFWSQRSDDAKIVRIRNSKLALREIADMVAEGEDLLPLLKRREPGREHGSFDPGAGDQSRQFKSSVEVLDVHSRRYEGGRETAHRNFKWPVEVRSS